MILTQHLHPAVVHFPIALLLVASGAGLVYMFLWPRGELRLVTWWSMGLGWIATAVAVVTGLVAQAGLPPQAPYRGALNLHIGGGLALLVVYGALLYLEWLQRRPRTVRKSARGVATEALDLLDDPARRWLVVVLLATGAAIVFATGFYGGELVYVWGVNVGQ